MRTGRPKRPLVLTDDEQQRLRGAPLWRDWTQSSTRYGRSRQTDSNSSPLQPRSWYYVSATASTGGVRKASGQSAIFLFSPHPTTTENHAGGCAHTGCVEGKTSSHCLGV